MKSSKPSKPSKPKPLVPRLRFPEFRNAGEWEERALGEVAIFVRDRHPIAAINKSEYISTENMLPNFAGIAPPTTFPATGSAIAFKANDVLISNIRPYLKKVWKATREGGASNDIVVIRRRSILAVEYLPTLLKSDAFIDYIMKDAKGVKMPRGDVARMKAYVVGVPSLAEQQKIADCLRSLDDLIAAQQAKLDALRQHKQGLLQQLFPSLEGRAK